MRYMPDAGKTVYYRAMPDWMGELTDEGYYAQLFDAAAFLAERTRGRIT